MYRNFSLVLTVNHNSNLGSPRSDAGPSADRPMPIEIGCKAIDRAVNSLEPLGTLELSFFGGEPLIEAEKVLALIDHARARTRDTGTQLTLALSTNGTQTAAAAWRVMTLSDLDLTISHDGLPAVHDRHRAQFDGGATSEVVVATMRRLLAGRKEFNVVMVVRPDNVEQLPDGIAYLRSIGARTFEPSLDLWTDWPLDAVNRLERAVERVAKIWRQGLPAFSISWFDEKAAQITKVPLAQNARCGFGDGSLAVAPSGNLYPCERLMSDDAADNPHRLPGHVNDGDDFIIRDAAPGRSDEACNVCTMQTMCSTICRCSNIIRSGDATKPDGLLCRWNQACLIETNKAVQELAAGAK